MDMIAMCCGGERRRAKDRRERKIEKKKKNTNKAFDNWCTFISDSSSPRHQFKQLLQNKKKKKKRIKHLYIKSRRKIFC